MTKQFKALESVKTDQGNQLSIIERSIDDLPEGELLIKVHYSSLNYKDALSATGAPGVTRNYPHTPGIDAVGIIEQSSNPNFNPVMNILYRLSFWKIMQGLLAFRHLKFWIAHTTLSQFC